MANSICCFDLCFCLCHSGPQYSHGSPPPLRVSEVAKALAEKEARISRDQEQHLSMRSSRHSRYTVHVLYAKLRKGRFGAFNLLQSSVIRDSKSPESRMLRSQRDSHVLSTLKISSQLIVSQQPKSSAAHGNLTLTLTLRFQALLYYILRTSPDSSSSCYRLLYLHQGTTEEYCDFTRRLTLDAFLITIST